MRDASKKIKKAVSLDAKRAEQQGPFYCCRCGTSFGQRRNNFPVSHSHMYLGTGYLPFCRDCVDELYEIYFDRRRSKKEALRAVCMKLDIYWHPAIFEMANNGYESGSLVRRYIGKTNLYKYIGKTFDDTLAEEEAEQIERLRFPAQPSAVSGDGGDRATDNSLISDDPDTLSVAPDVIAFWGSGFQPSLYVELEQKYKAWTDGLGGDVDPGAQAIYKQICILECTINKDLAAGRSIAQHENALNTLLGSAKLRPAQKTNTEDAELENMPFGVGIRRWENTRPIPEPDPEFQDVDGIVRYITVWFLGHLCKMLGIKNTYCKLYEEEMERLRVRAPEFEDEDDESLFNDIFGGDAGG
jgi:hypothetical protein